MLMRASVSGRTDSRHWITGARQRPQVVSCSALWRPPGAPAASLPATPSPSPQVLVAAARRPSLEASVCKCGDGHVEGLQQTKINFLPVSVRVSSKAK
ncbi:hypothetical protein SEA_BARTHOLOMEWSD_2 [Streptomyces phage BartholomewSD]|nr:hypothetical protein SEA_BARTHOLOMEWSD_2 [Streptomyces phage BartholomewSD]